MSTVITNNVGQRSEFSLETWESLLNDPHRLEFLLSAGKNFICRFEEAVDGFRVLQRYANSSYLVDFDVVSDLLAVDIPDPDSDESLDFVRRQKFRVYSWYRYAHRKRRFWMPWGAFQELLNSLQNVVSTKQVLQQQKRRDLGRNGTLQDLARQLGIDSPESLHEEDLNSEILMRLKHSQLRLNRLNEFLAPGSLSGVKGIADDEIVDILYRWLSKCPRFSKGRESVTCSRKDDPRDRRDALNVAIAIESAIGHINQSQNKLSDDVVVLVTATGILNDLANPSALLTDDLLGIPEYRRPRMNLASRRQLLNDLRNKLVSRGAHDIFSRLPIVSVHQVHTAELLGFFDRPELALRELREQIRQLRKVVEFCEDYSEINIQCTGSDRQSVQQFLDTNRNAAVKALTDFGGRFSARSEFSLANLEDYRSTEVGLGRQVVINDDRISIGSASDSIETLTSHFLYAASSVEQKVKKHIDYSFSIQKIEAIPPYISFSLNETSQGATGAVVFEGEAYPKDVSGLPLFVFRIPTFTYLKEFLDAVQFICFEDTNAFSLRPLEEVDDDSLAWQTGLLVFCGKEWLGSTFTQGQLSLALAFQEAFQSARVVREFRHNNILVRPEPMQVRICREHCDLAFDCSVLDDEIRRYVRYVTPLPSSDLLEKLVLTFFQRFSNPDVLRITVDRLISKLDQELVKLQTI